MKNFFLFSIAFALVACSANQPVSPILVKTVAPPPNSENTSTITPFAPTQIEVINALGSGLSSLAEANIQKGMYDYQIQGIKNWWAYWRENQFVNEANIQVVFFEDQNNDPASVMAAVDLGDAYYFPPLRLISGEIPKPAYDSTEWTDAPLKIYKTISYDQVVEQGYSSEIATLLNGSIFEIRGRQMTRTINGKVVAYIAPEGKWVPEETRFQMLLHWDSEFNNGNMTPPWVTQEDLEAKSWLHYVMRNNSQNLPDFSKIIWSPISAGSLIRYQISEAEDTWNADPSTRASIRVSFAAKASSYSNGSPFDTVRVVIFLRPDGGQVWVQVVSNSNPHESFGQDLPNYDASTNTSGWTTSPETKALYDQWINSGNPPWIPLELDGAIMTRFYY